MKKITLKLQNGKSYTADLAELPLGVIKNLCKSISLEAILKDSKTDDEFVRRMIIAVMTSFDIFEKHVLTVFEGLTQEELDKYCTASEMAAVLTEILQYTAFKVSGIGAGLKNLVRAETT